MKKTKFERLKMHLLHLMRELMHLFPKKKMFILCQSDLGQQ